MIDSLQCHGQQNTSLPCSYLSPRVCSNSCPLSWWCHPTISSSVTPLSYFPQSFQHQGIVQWVRFCTWDGQSIGDSAFSMSPSNEYSGLIFLMIDWFDLITLQGISRVLSSTIIWKHQFFGTQPSLWSKSHITTRKTIVLMKHIFFSKVMSLLLNVQSWLS